MKTSELYSAIAAAAPSLKSWCSEMGDADEPIGESVVHFQFALLERRHDGRIEELSQLTPLIERLLDENDDHDQVSLGLIEPLVWRALDGTLDAEQTRQALGPAARSVWDDLYLSARRKDLRAVQFEGTPPAVFAEWLIRPNQWVSAGKSIARIALGNRHGVLRIQARCWIDRFAAVPGHSLSPGDLLLYIAPESPRTPKGEQLCALVVEPAA